MNGQGRLHVLAYERVLLFGSHPVDGILRLADEAPCGTGVVDIRTDDQGDGAVEVVPAVANDTFDALDAVADAHEQAHALAAGHELRRDVSTSHATLELTLHFSDLDRSKSFARCGTESHSSPLGLSNGMDPVIVPPYASKSM